jgi:hypothetical protein
MCGEDLYHGHRAAEGEDEFVLDTPTVRRFVEGVRATIEETRGPEEATEAVRPAFARLLSDRTWLPPGRSSTKRPELRFRALLTELGTERLEFQRA